MGLRPTKGDEDAEWFNSWQAETPAPPSRTVDQKGGAGVSACQLPTSSTELYHETRRKTTSPDSAQTCNPLPAPSPNGAGASDRLRCIASIAR